MLNRTITNPYLQSRSFLFLGTKWCGTGKVAKYYSDLASGSGRKADICCREHDHCPLYVQAGEKNETLGVDNTNGTSTM